MDTRPSCPEPAKPTPPHEESAIRVFTNCGTRGSVAIADTYNGAIRRFDPVTREVTTLATGLAEPSDVVVVRDDARGQVLLVVESTAHRPNRIALPDEALQVEAAAYRTPRPPLEIAWGAMDLEVLFTPPTGHKLDDRYGPSTHVVVSASPPELLAGGAGAAEFPAWHVHQQD